MGRLTKRAVDALEPPEKGQAFLWDGELRGFGVRVIASGLKTFVVQYRSAEGRSRRMTLGRFGPLTVDQARARARVTLGAVAAGDDPAEDRQRQGRPVTVAEVCDWYLAEAEAGRLLGRSHRPIKPSTLAMDRSRIETHIKPLLGRRAVRTLTVGDIERMQADIASGATARRRGSGRGGATTGGTGVAARSVTTFRALLGHARRHGVIKSNPATGARRFPDKHRDRRLSLVEIGRLGVALRDGRPAGLHPTGLAMVRVLLLTGFRIGEARSLQWDWIDHEQGCVRFPDTKSGPQVRVIGRRALDLLTPLPVPGGSPFVFPADQGDGPFTAAPDTLRRLCAMTGLTDVTPHTLRHTFASVAGDLGFSELTIAALLGHAARGVTQGYVHIDAAQRLAADRVAEDIANRLEP
ncbi:tyrosine-type recombinase/integrase [Roseospira visakhapatnamensis]|uniref:Integrase n=1 Tax=Roseospira visakhapatnamensis TaxID=390880 RepID=A0A7W6RDT1_9PROT|nr:site-specific integrase [Roseospira visakhapatnamensis]MBB4266680.1 integrase [Roseospira visakhapatnamensis]